MDNLVQDIRYAAKRLRRSPGFTLVVVLTLALGIGANSAIFSVVNAVLVRPLPFAEPDRIDRLYTTHPQHGRVPTSPPDFLQVQAENRSYSAVAAYAQYHPGLVGEGDPVRLRGTRVSASFFQVLGIAPALGRTLRADENEPGQSRVALIGHALWQQHFGGAPSVLGRTIRLDGELFEIVGVLPPGFDYPTRSELWTPLEYTPEFRDDALRSAHYLAVIGRRRSDVSLSGAEADIAAIGSRIAHDFAAQKAGMGATVGSLREEIVGDIRTPLLILLGAVGLVLLIACANVANLLLARASAREGEVAVRAALGASRGRLVRQFLTESVLLSILGGGVGLFLASAGTQWLLGLDPQGIPRLAEVGMDWRVIAFTAGVAVLTGLVFGIVPAWQASGGELQGLIRAGGRGAVGGRSAAHTRRVLVVAETALAVVLLASAGLLIRSFVALRSVDPGFRTDHTLVADVALPGAAYPDIEQVRGFFAELETRLGSLPGVQAVGLTSILPLGEYERISPFWIEGRAEAGASESPTIALRAATPGYFGAIGIPVKRGRAFAEADRADAPRVLLLSESAASRFFPGEDPIGRRIHLGNPAGGEPPWGEVVGIVGDVHGSGLANEPAPILYRPFAQATGPAMSVVLRASTEPASLATVLRREVAAMDPHLPIFNVATLGELVDGSVSRPRFYMILLSVFAGCALVLAAVGIFGVMSYSVARRRREIGIRIALGARPESVLRLVVGNALGLTLAGVSVGLVGALLGTRLLSSLLFGVAPTDPLTFAAVAVLLTAVALLASYLPSRQAIRVDPMQSLRGD